MNTKTKLPVALARLHQLVFIILVFGSLHCRPEKENRSPLDPIRELLNQSLYGEAVRDLEAYRLAHPDDDEASYLLATAYTGSTGVNLIESFDFFSKLLIKEPQVKDAPKKILLSTDSVPVAPNDKEKIEKIAKLFHHFALSVSKNSDIFFAMPFVASERRSFIVESLLILRKIPETSPTAIRARAYQGFLNLLQFANYTKDIFPQMELSEESTADELLCQINLNNVGILLDHSDTYFADLIGDLEWIAPRKSSQIAK